MKMVCRVEASEEAIACLLVGRREAHERQHEGLAKGIELFCEHGETMAEEVAEKAIELFWAREETMAEARCWRGGLERRAAGPSGAEAAAGCAGARRPTTRCSPERGLGGGAAAARGGRAVASRRLI